MKRDGFTLVELLIVIGLIALLLALLIPGLIAAKRYADRAKCASQLSALGKAVHAYFADNRAWPRRSNVTYPYEWDNAFFEQMFTSYLTDPRLLYCPSNSHDMSPPDTTWSQSWTGEQRQFSYVLLDGKPGPANDLKVADSASDYEWLSKSYRRYRKWDSNLNYGRGSWGSWRERFPLIRPLWSTFWEDQNAPIAGDLILERPNGSWIVNHGMASDQVPLGMNVLLADGHVNWMTPDPSSGDENKQRSWRRIWHRKSTGEYLHWVWNPSEIEHPPSLER